MVSRQPRVCRYVAALPPFAFTEELALRLDLVIPAHNEANRIASTIVRYLAALGPEDRILVALDGCTDSTADVVVSTASGDPRVEVLCYPKLGKGGVLIETFRRCRADVVGFVDADGATPPSELHSLVQLVTDGGFDGAIAGRRHGTAVLPKRRPRMRRLTSAGFAIGIRALFGLPFADTQCGAKVLRRSLIEECVPLLSARDFLFDVDLLHVAIRRGARIAEVPTVWIDDRDSRLVLGRDTRRMALSAVSLWLHHHVLPVPTAASEPDAAAVIALDEHRPALARAAAGVGGPAGTESGVGADA